MLSVLLYGLYHDVLCCMRGGYSGTPWPLWIVFSLCCERVAPHTTRREAVVHKGSVVQELFAPIRQPIVVVASTGSRPDVLHEGHRGAVVVRGGS